jgi:ABC-type phosphate/phosphonate transport system ATPase subunit
MLGKRAATPSGGQRQALAIARTPMSDPSLLILDEPSAGLAPLVQDEVFATIQAINRLGGSLPGARKSIHGPEYKIGYARVSTLDQNLALQQDSLKAAGCEKIFMEQMSGAVTDSPALRKALGYARGCEVATRSSSASSTAWRDQ